MYAMKDGSKTLPYTESKPAPGTTMLLKERHKQQEWETGTHHVGQLVQTSTGAHRTGRQVRGNCFVGTQPGYYIEGSP